MKYYLGIDIGSVSTNVIAMDNNYNVCFNQYIRANGQPLESVKKGMTKLKEAIGCQDDDILGIGTTGSGRELAGVLRQPSIFTRTLKPFLRLEDRTQK